MNRFRRSPAIQITPPPPRKALPRRLRRNQNLKRTRLRNSSTQLPCGCSQESLDSALMMLIGLRWYLISQLLSELFGGFRKRICRPCFAIARLPSRSPWKRPARPAKTRTRDCRKSNPDSHGWIRKSAVCARCPKRKLQQKRNESRLAPPRNRAESSNPRNRKLRLLRKLRAAS